MFGGIVESRTLAALQRVAGAVIEYLSLCLKGCIKHEDGS